MGRVIGFGEGMEGGELGEQDSSSDVPDRVVFWVLGQEFGG